LLNGFITGTDGPVGSELLQALSVNKKNRAKITFVIFNNRFIKSFFYFLLIRLFGFAPFLKWFLVSIF
jgi:hypothetical protein